MNFESYRNYDSVGLAKLVADGEVSADELLKCCIERIEAVNPTINAVTYKQYDSARAAIAGGLPNGPLKGVPFLIKHLNNYDAGHPTTNGSKLFKDFVPDHDATYVERVKNAGLVIVGRTNTPEMGLNPTTEPIAYGATKNPWNLEHSAGGSSGGASAAVAAGIMPTAQATDGGGSIRIPAANCGLVGLKPTRGRNPLGPDVGEGWGGMSTGHVVSRTVRDTAVFLDCTHGPAPGDPYYAPVPDHPFAEDVGRDPGQLRIAVMTTNYDGKPLAPDCVKAIENTAKLCEALGHHVEPAMPEITYADYKAAGGTIISANVANTLKSYCRQLGRELRPNDVETTTWATVQSAAKRSAEDMAAAVAKIHQLGRIFGRFFQKYDLLLGTTLSNPPLPLGYLDANTDDVGEFAARMTDELCLTPPFNWTGSPAISLPMYWTTDGLPVGVHFGADFGNEALLIQIAAQMEVAQPWFENTPNV